MFQKKELKRCCLGGQHSKTNTHHNNLYDFDCGSTIEQVGTGMVCNCGLYICYQCLRKIEKMYETTVMSDPVPEYLNGMFSAMRCRKRNVQICHGCFYRRVHKKESFQKENQRHVLELTSKYAGCLLFKEFGFLVDGNITNVKERTSVYVHGLG